MGNAVVVLTIAVAYLLIVLVIGGYAAARTLSSREDFLVASRSFGFIVLFMALFATNMTAVVMIGAPGFGYQAGVGTWGYFGTFFAFFMPLFLITVAHRIWLAGKAHGHVTPGQMLDHRLGSRYFGPLLAIIYTVWTIPYILIGVQGGGIAFQSLTQGLVPYWLGGLIISLVVLIYVFFGGMRATAWSNVFQGAIFIVFVPVIFIAIAYSLGGFGEATATTAAAKPHLLNRASVPPFQTLPWLSQGLLVALGGVIFPHMFIRYMTAESPKVLNKTAIAFPIAIAFLWFPGVMIGFWGAGQLQVDSPDFILPALTAALFPAWIMGLILAGILAAIMSSIDAQVLTLGTMFTEDILHKFRRVGERWQVVWTRIFIVLVVAATFVYSLLTTDTLIDTVTFAFSGYALTFFPSVLPLYWERFNKWGAYVGLLFGFVGLWAFQLGWIPESLTFGFYPVVPLLVVQLVLIVITVKLTPPAPQVQTEQYKELFSKVKW